MTTELKCVCRDPDPQGGYCQNCGESCVIKDCPFCGHSAALESVGVDHFVMCDGCCAESARWQSPTGEPGMAKRSAIAAWNRRAALAQQPQGEAVASQSAEPVALTDERIREVARKYCEFDSAARQYNILRYEIEEDFFNFVRAIATTPAATGAQGHEIGALTDEIVGRVLRSYIADLSDEKLQGICHDLCLESSLAQSAPRADHSAGHSGG